MKNEIKRRVVAPFDITKLERCPYCGSTNIDGDDGLRAKKIIRWHCNYCGAKWDDEGLRED